MRKKNKDRGYEAALSGVRGLIRLLLYVLLAVVLLFLAKFAYEVTYGIFHQEAMESGEGRDVSFLVREDQTTKDIAKALEGSGLIKSPFIFCLQTKLSGYEGKIKAGNYILKTSMTTDEILAVLAQENKEGQPEQEKPQK